MKLLNFIILICISAFTYGQNVTLERYDSSRIFIVQTDTIFNDSLPGTINIQKQLMTKEEAKRFLFRVADQNKLILENQDNSLKQFKRMKNLFEKESGVSFNDQLIIEISKTLNGNYVFLYQGQKVNASILNNELIFDDSTKFSIEILNRASVKIAKLFAGNSNTTFKITRDRLLGEYRGNRVEIVRAQ